MSTTESAITFPLLPGKRQALAEFIAQLEEKQTEHDSTHANVTHESWFLQETPRGDVVIVYLKAADTIDVFAKMAVSKAPFANWFREQVRDLTGVDLVLLPPFSLPERVFHRGR